jgi:predicted TIM-barrel fold metal-dependent hydrolase
LTLIDHHCHGVARGRLDRAAFELLLTESDRPPPAGCSTFDSLLGLAVRRWCAPILDLPAGAEPDEYVARRASLGAEEVNRRLLSAAGAAALLVETGLAGGELLGLDELAALSGGAAVHEVVRLESVAEAVAAGGVRAGEFAAELGRRVRRGPVAVKSIVAYRYGVDFDPRPPSVGEVEAAAERWLREGGRLTDVVLLRHLLWEGIATGLPLQLHTGFGDPDVTLHRSDPSLLTEFLRTTVDAGPPVLLLHCYPYHRQGAYLANVFPHVYLDIGLTIPHVGARGPAVLAEALELAPFHKLLYSSDAYGLAELYLVAAVEFRRALDEVLGVLVGEEAERRRIAEMIGAGNARRVYALRV